MPTPWGTCNIDGSRPSVGVLSACDEVSWGSPRGVGGEEHAPVPQDLVGTSASLPPDIP